MTEPRTSTIICAHCGGRCLVDFGNLPRPSRVTNEMRIVRRVRCCENCGKSFSTTEMDSAELADLRRRAYLYERSIGSATP